MITLRKAEQRGHTRLAWLDSRHSFSFADYYDPAEMGWGVLRVLNDDRVTAGAGFPTHGHRDMEILTWVLDGALEHRDSLGTGSVIRPGEIQRMSAGRGIRHSEYNASREQPVHFLQIWIETAQTGLEPGYAQIAIASGKLAGQLALIASADGRQGSISLNQDVLVFAARLATGQRVDYALPAGRIAYLHVASGSLELNGQRLAAGDGAKIRAESSLVAESGEGAELLLFDLPAE